MSRVAVVHSFILPGRCEAASRLHFARTLARRAERRLVELSADIAVRQVLMRYINRLSDCLYALARAEDHDAHQRHIINEVTRRYLASTYPSTIKESSMSLSFQELHQLIRSAVARAEELHVPVVISIVDGKRHANRDLADARRVAGQQRTGAQKSLDRRGHEIRHP
ncbi:ATP/cobalamin adenosyltransferase [Salmonella enterica subsp. arizonae]|uniref:Corrinoid adenosyltransferase n=1 Tax=Salmonella enterica subsp. arizonae TaxID=59203 RepID=A0A379SSW8_SALER|nr:ATP/cobalamin adenosyltransferase [Salmonella enterica subsp. arizonae]